MIVLDRAAAVTGIGVVSPGGTSRQRFWEFLCGGGSAAGLVSGLAEADVAVAFGCEVREFDPEGILGQKLARRHERFTLLGLAAALAAIDDAGTPDVTPESAAVIVGSGLGGLGAIDPQACGRGLVDAGTRINPTLIPRIMPNAPAAIIALELGWRGPNLAVGTACAAGTHAVGEGLRLLREGAADVVLAGAAEAPITPLVVNAFAALGALSRRHDDPSSASRPFDKARDGFVIGEGGAFLVLEPVARARARGARIYALLAGYGRNTDAHNLVTPDPTGEGARACMELALKDAGVVADDVVHVNAHGTSTPMNDVIESRAITAVLAGRSVPVTSAKGAIGHAIGAAGAIEAAAACLTVAHGVVPPVANTTDVDDEIDADIVIAQPRELAARGAVLSNSFAFGGHNGALVFLPPDP